MMNEVNVGYSTEDGNELQMPGGLNVSGSLHRRFRVKPITGHASLDYIESLNRAANLPVAVTRLLGEILEMDGRAIGFRVAEAMCVGDRRYAMLNIGRLLAGDHVWMHPQCPRCDRLFDVGVRRSELPVKQAGDGFPFAEIELGGDLLRLRVPTGLDQARSLNWGASAQLDLVQSCFVSVSGNKPPDKFVAGLGAEDIEEIDRVLDDVAPDVGTRIATACPDCNAEHEVELNPYEIGLDRDSLFGEIHTLAFHYHWSETDVLSLPHNRRQRYLGLINRERNMSS